MEKLTMVLTTSVLTDLIKVLKEEGLLDSISTIDHDPVGIQQGLELPPLPRRQLLSLQHTRVN